ncbi:anthrone oxygenase family protein [Paenibacillus andongensis]|uniref:anthrone oxygenase family protein n=1 Tax=Paenibacillus andongensis TaxID=2975482 RepID=UPI0021BB557E|nr:anthrone oxygenase family protein [Paenibacillus andongensis]
MAKWTIGLTYASALGSGLIAGIFFAFSTFVMAALARLPAAQGIVAMQSINSTILQTLFSFVFMGTAFVSVVLGGVSFFRLGTPGALYILIGSLLYFVGAFVATIIFNVPLNDALAAVEPGSAKGAEVWQHYLSRWVAWNHVRTIASLASLAAFIIALRRC